MVHDTENRLTSPTPPTTYENPRNDDPWDNDAVCWLLEHEDVASEFPSRTRFFECARRQPNKMETDLDGVISAARLCERYGVEQIRVQDPRIGKQVWRLRRTDPDAPEYPAYGESVAESTFTVEEEDRAAAQRLLELIGAYEAALVQKGRARPTVHTYVDRAERFLRAVIQAPTAR